MELTVFKTNNIEGFMKSKEFQDFDKRCAEYTARVISEARDGLTPEETKWFDRWNSGECIDWKTVPKKAHLAIMYVISMGLG